MLKKLELYLKKKIVSLLKKAINAYLFIKYLKILKKNKNLNYIKVEIFLLKFFKKKQLIIN